MKAAIKVTTLIFILFISVQAQSDIILTEIMFSPSVNGTRNEFVELYNPTNQTIDLKDYQIGVVTSSDFILSINDSTLLAPNSFAVVVEGDYDTTDTPYTIPGSALVVKIDDNAFGSSGMSNSSDRMVFVLNGVGDTASTYTYSANNSAGYSDEKIILNNDNSSSNWANALVLNGTPGFKNSVSPKENDLGVISITTTPSQPIENINISAQVKVENLGTINAVSYSISLYEDADFDSTADAGELINSFPLNNLASGDSVTQNFSLGSFPVGDIRLIAVVEFAADEDTSNNQLIENFTIAPNPPTYNAVVINEIMYAPSTGEPEWVEIYNRSSTSYLIKDWKISDASSSSTITTESIYIRPEEYIVIASTGDIENFYDIESRLIISGLPALNNTGDKVALSDFNSDVVDSLTYLPSWGGASGKSLERINFDKPSTDSTNWGNSISPFNATPGSINSITQKTHDIGIENVSFAPSPAVDGDDITISVSTKNFGLQSASNYLINFYWDQNQDSVAQTNERIEGESQSLAPGDSGIVQFQFLNVTEGKYYFIFKVNYGDDEYEFNNTYYAVLTVGGKPLPYNSIVINEIMYTPQDDEPEWIELFNRSDNTVNIKRWHISDATASVTITNDDLIIDPNSFLVIADNENISDYYDFSIPFISANLPALNNDGDTIILSDSLHFSNDSLKYTSSWGGTNGKSLERIDVDIQSTLQSNWGTSVDPDNGTPGKTNSLVPREFDLALTYFNSVSSFLFIDEETEFISRIKNLGTSSANNANLKIYLDLNDDSLFTESEILEEFTNIELTSGEETERSFTYKFGESGEAFLLAVVEFNNDTYSRNDSLFLSKQIIEPSVSRNQIIINEFMYAPTAPYPEWIELYNNSNTAFQLRNFSIADLNDTVSISSQNILLQPESYLVISGDSIISQLYNIPSQIIIKSFPSLNNSGDRLMLLDNYNRIIDSLDYSSDWGGTDGRSLERINPFGNSTEQSNWATSTDPDNGTPGKINSTAPKDYDVAITNFYSNPQQPVIGETVSLFADITNNGLNDAAFNLLLYESNSAGEKLNLIETVNIENLSAGNSASIEFNYKITSFTGERFFITEAYYPEDQDSSNNSSLLFISSAAAPLSIIVNEIMFNPQDDEPEWIEIYNNSENSINLRDWQISDVITTPAYATITTENYYVEPGKFVVLSKDSGIYEYHPNLSEGVILLNFAILNNTEDGVVIYNRFGETIDSVFYSNQFSKKTGHSIERIWYDGSSTDPANWDYSISPERSTPGFINSRTPKNYDLAVEDISLSPKFPELNEQIQINIHITNLGLLQSAPATVKVSSSTLPLNETIELVALDSEANITITTPNTFNMPESFEVSAEINFAEDENLANNILSKTFYSGYAASSVLINEVMYAPSSEETEWVELINASSTDINIKEWKIAEGSTFDSPRIITEQDIIVKPGEYIIVADDTTGGVFADVNAHIFEVDFGEMNSTEDIVAVFDFRGAIIDSLKYSSSWGGGNGYSIERISLQAPTNERTNWLASITMGGSTPGAANSIVNIKQLDEDQKVVINEIMFDPNSGDSEFIEFYNTSDQFLEVANWNVEDGSKNNSILTHNTFQIAPDSYFLVAADSTILLTYPELKEFDQLMIVNGNLSLNNTDDLILLSDAFGNMVDSVHYKSDWHNQRIITTKGKSIERINPFLDGNDMNNWSTSVASEGATPGSANSIYIENQESNKTISVTPNPFSPDGDGYEDFSIINYNLPREITSIQIKVFDSKGRKVRTINESNLFGKSGSIIFDGYNDDGQPLKIGIYILLIEALNSSSGTVDTFKEVVVVARKL